MTGKRKAYKNRKLTCEEYSSNVHFRYKKNVKIRSMKINDLHFQILQGVGKVTFRNTQAISTKLEQVYSVKYPDLFFLEHLVDLNEARLHEATLNLHTHRWIVSRLSIASVDGKQHLSEVVFSTLIGFSLLEKYLNFGWEQPEVARWHIRRVRSLVNYKSLVYHQNSLNQVQGMCRILSWWRR